MKRMLYCLLLACITLLPALASGTSVMYGAPALPPHEEPPNTMSGFVLFLCTVALFCLLVYGLPWVIARLSRLKQCRAAAKGTQ